MRSSKITNATNLNKELCNDLTNINLNHGVKFIDNLPKQKQM